MTESRDKAWKTRRAKYGDRGHYGSYARSGVPCSHCRGAIEMIICLHNEGVLSEGQVAKALKMDRVEVRRRADDLTLSLTSKDSR